MNWQVLSPQADGLGESPFWHPGEQMLYWVDIPGQQVRRANPAGAVESWALPSEPGCIAPAAGGGYALALRDGMYRAAAWGGALKLLARFSHDTATTRFNDGKADPAGRFWAGTMYEPRDKATAELFSLDMRAGGSPLIERKAGDATIANGLAWSPDEKTVYWTDTIQHTIWAWDWDKAGNAMSRQRVFARFKGKPEGWQYGLPGCTPETYGGRPDGAAVDAQGNYWVAMFEGARVLKLSPFGEQLAAYSLPAQCPTMPCFGGADLKTLYVTTASYNRPAAEMRDMPQSGCVFSLPVDVPGLPVNFFQD